MKSLFFFAIIQCSFGGVILDFTKQCGCTDFVSYNDCLGLCTWSKNACKIAICSDFTNQVICSPANKCKWSGISCSDATACSDFTTQAQCESAGWSDLNCAWNTACAAFTQCSHYTPTNGICTSVKKQRCQVQPSDSTKCQAYNATLLDDCRTFTSQATCDVNYGRCAWSSNACDDFSSCSAANGNPTVCAYKGAACTYNTDNKCVPKTCADITVEAACTYVSSFDSKSGTLCTWTNSKCIDAADTKAIKSANCRSNTGYTHAWNGTYCQVCGATENSNTQNSTTQQQGSSVILDFNNKDCNCSDIQQQTQCIGKCIWKNSVCQNAKCSDYTTNATCLSYKCKFSENGCEESTCTDFTDSQKCQLASLSGLDCAWNQSSCEKFTECANYTPVNGDCPMGLSHYCKISESDSKKCEYSSIYSFPCDTYKSQDICNSHIGMCIWNNKCQDFSQCSDADGNQSKCNERLACSPNISFGKCIERTCSDIHIEQLCTFVYKFNGLSGTLCQWNNGQCQNATSKSYLTESTCLQNTKYTHKWNGSSCVQCQSESNCSSLLVMLVIIILV